MVVGSEGVLSFGYADRFWEVSVVVFDGCVNALCERDGACLVIF